MINFLNPAEVLKQIKLKDSMTAADFGCGAGGWVIPLSKKLDEGKIFAVDILEEPLSALKARIKLEKITNIQTILADVEKKVDIWEESCDLVLMTNLLFECEDKKKVLAEGKRVLRQGGMILVVDWIKDNPLTKQIEYVSFDEIKELAKELNLKIEKEFPAGDYHYALVLIKPARVLPEILDGVK